MAAGGAGAPVTVGIDLGTQSVRVVLLREDGTVVSSGTAPLGSSRAEGGRHEQDPAEWWEAVGRAAREATGGFEGVAVDGLSICSTSGTFLLADARGRPLTPALMYDDGRAGEEAELALHAGAELWDLLGHGMQRSWALPKLAWLARRGETKGAARFMHQADYVGFRLAGRPVATDWSHALKTGYDLLGDRWPEGVMEQLSIPVGILPPAVRPGTEIGSVSEEASDHTGLPAGAPIRAGMTDSCAAQIGAGALVEGRWNSVLGTTLALKGVSPELVRDPTGAVYCHRHPDGGWLPGGASNTGAGVISERFSGRDLDALGERAGERGPATVAVYPLSTEGERFPFADPEARGFELGQPEDEVDLYRAILEGVAFVEQLCFAHLGSLGAEATGPVALTGGGSKSRLWSQIRADVLGLPVVVPASAEPSVGMAILARAGTGSVGETAARMSKVLERFEPDGEARERLAPNFERLADEFVERGYIPEELARRAKLS